MADIREQLRKAGLVNDKQVRRAKHEERLRAAEVGREGLAAERAAEEERLRREAEARRQADRAREEEARRRAAEEAQTHKLGQSIRGGWIRDATAGARRFFFVTPSGRISFIDLSDMAARRVVTGGAAIVQTLGHVRGEYCVVTDRAASEIEKLAPATVLFWNRNSPDA